MRYEIISVSPFDDISNNNNNNRRNPLLLAGAPSASLTTATSATFARLVTDLTPVMYFLLGLSGLTLIAIYFIPGLAVDPDTAPDPSTGLTHPSARYTQSTSVIIENTQPLSKLIGHFIAGQVLLVLIISAMPYYAWYPELFYLGLACWLGLAGVLTFDVSSDPMTHTVCVGVFATSLLIYTHIFCLVASPREGEAPDRLLSTFLFLLDASTIAFVAIFITNWVVLHDASRGSLETYQSTAELVWEVCIVMTLCALVTMFMQSPRS